MPPSPSPGRSEERSAPPAPAVLQISAHLIDALRALPLLEPAQLDEAAQLAAAFPDARLLANELTRRGWLTAYQTRLLLQGRGAQLVLGRWIILDKLGEGGMGAVYKARDTKLKRIVAIKLLRRDRSTRPELIQRFRREVAVASNLSHPNVVRTIDTETVDGAFVFAMEYIEGINLTQLVQKRGALPVPMACDFIRQAALGLQHAHEKGLVHRDIKPSNLVVTRTLDPTLNGHEPSVHGLIKLLDMGLALILPREGEQEKTRLTQLGKVVGTADFLAPEQAVNSHEVDIRADIYSLGCTFYFLLSARLPFPKGTPVEKLFKHQMDDPTPIEDLRPGIPPKLIAIVRKLMAKKPADRYQTPAEVARLLEPFTDPDRQAVAIPVAVPVASPAGSGDSKTAILPAVPDSQPFAFTLNEQQAPARDGGELPATPRRSRSRLIVVLVGFVLLAAFYIAAMMHSPIGPDQEESSTSGVNNPPKPSKPIEPWTLDKLDTARIPPAERIAGLPREVVAVFGEQRGRHWDVNNLCIVFSPDAQMVASGGMDGFIRLWNAGTGEEVGILPMVPTHRVVNLAFLDGGRLVSLHHDGRTAELVHWNLRGKTATSKIALGGFLPTPSAFSPNQKLLALVSRQPDGTASRVSLVKVENGTESGSLPPEKMGMVTKLAWSPNGKLLAGVNRNAIRLWSREIGEAPAAPQGHDQSITAVAFGPDSNTLVSAAPTDPKNPASPTVKFWDVAAGKMIKAVPCQGAIEGFIADSGGQLMAWGRNGNQVTFRRFGNTDTPPFSVPVGNQLTALAIAPGAKMLATSSQVDKTLRLWDVASRKERGTRPPFRGTTISMVMSPDGRSLGQLIKAGHLTLRVLDLAVRRECHAIRVLADIQSIGYLPDGSTLAGWGKGSAMFWDLESGRRVAEFKAPPNTELRTGSADGQTVLAVGKDEIKAWNPLTGKERFSLKGQYRYSAVSPDCKLLALVTRDKPTAVRIIDVALGKEKSPPGGMTGPIRIVAFSADSRLVVAIGDDWSVRAWDINENKESAKFSPHPGTLNFAFAPTGPRLALWSGNTMWFLDVATGKEAVRKNAPVRTALFAPSGGSLATVTPDGFLDIVDTTKPTEKPTHHIAFPGPIENMAFAADGRHLVTANGNATVYVLRPRCTFGEPGRVSAGSLPGADATGLARRHTIDYRRVR